MPQTRKFKVLLEGSSIFFFFFFAFAAGSLSCVNGASDIIFGKPVPEQSLNVSPPHVRNKI